MVLAQPSTAQQDTGSSEVSFLSSLEGRFSGNGTLQNAGGTSRSLKCQFDGDQQGSGLSLNGSCTTAAILSATIKIELRHDPDTGRYIGTFKESTGTVAKLAGTRQGQRLTLAFNETAESVRPNPPATLTISRQQDGVALTLRGSQPGQGQNLDLSLREN
ncbi:MULTISPECIES: hypothetical protein [unclassified Bosea (in: a-proteobacteria)]|uniref:hypothetical protein n=1 Tax=unclassified Bosea (in: a-proteobacteria) TaxID=2653178 RepID=UPI000F7F009B|nr:MULTISPECIES: hypothetical protein [unclassified Bosea (in: a-proteobacteria)]